MRLNFLAKQYLKALTLVALLASSGFSQPGRFAPVGSNQPAPATSQNSTSTGNALYFEGFNIRCVQKIEVAAQADGLIKEMLVEEGSAVSENGLLFSIDNRVANAQLEVAAKKLESAQKQADQDADLRFAKATFKVAESEYESEMRMLETRSTSKASAVRKRLELEKSQLQIEVAMIKRETDKLAAGVAEAEMKAAQVQLGLYDIVAPFDAYVNQRLKVKGSWIRAGEPVLEIVQMSDMRAVGYVPLSELHKYGLGIANLDGARIQITVNITPTQTHTVDSVISFISADIDSADRIRVAASIKNQRMGESWLLRDGIPASVKVLLD